MDTDARIIATRDRNMARAAHSRTLYEAIEALPEGITGEILHGQLHTQPRPAPLHVLAASNLGAELLGPYFARA